MTRRLALSLLVVVLAACSSSSNPPSDAGDARPDSSSPDSSTPDSSSPDSSAPDANNPDATSPDSSTPDSSAPDANKPDATSSDGDGGSVDGSTLGCDQLAHDPILGTAHLGAAYRVVDSAVLPVTSWLPVAAVDQSLPGGAVGLVVYGYAGDGRVHRLGVWPDLAAPAPTNVAFDAVSPADRTFQILTTPQLVTTHGRLLAGYRTIRAGGFVSGGVSVFDTAHPEASARWLAAPGIESTLGLGSYFLVGGDGLGSAAGARGVYGVFLDEATFHPGLVARYPIVPNEQVRPGLMAASANGVVVMGHYLDGASRHSLRLPEPSAISEALSGGPAIDLGAAPELTQASDVANLASFSDGMVALQTSKVRGVLPALGMLQHYRVSRPGGDAGTAVGAPVPVLSASDDEACTIVSQLVPVTGGVTVIVGLWDRNGQRLVRLAAR